MSNLRLSEGFPEDDKLTDNLFRIVLWSFLLGGVCGGAVVALLLSVLYPFIQ